MNKSIKKKKTFSKDLEEKALLQTSKLVDFTTNKTHFAFHVAL